MILLLGASGYVGEAFARELTRRGWPFRPLARRELDYTNFSALLACLRDTKPTFLINAAGFTGQPNVDACETARAETLRGNTVLPLTISHACAVTGTPWGHISSGCIYNGTFVSRHGKSSLETDLTKPEIRQWIEAHPEAVRGFAESDTPNFSFRQPPCSFYSGSKALAEEALAADARCFLWRMRMPFDEFDQPRNYLAKLQRYPLLYDNINSLSHRGDFARACLDLWERRAPFGIYNVTNPGFVTTRQVVDLLQRTLKPARPFQFFENDAQFYRDAARAPRSNGVLDVSKLLAAGVKIPPVEEALLDALKHWKVAS